MNKLSIRHSLVNGLLALLLLMPLSVSAIPQTLSYQGTLTDSSGAPLNGAHSLNFQLYNVNSGGSALWSEIQGTVTVTNGLFTVELGNGTPFPLNLFAAPLWLGVSVNTDAEMSPRTPLSSEGYAFKAEDADRLEGVSAATLDQSAHAADTTTNPHQVSAGLIGAASATDLTTHTGATNPHGITATLAGAVDNATFSSHTGDASAHHSKTTSFAELTDLISDGQIPGAITRDTELAALQATITIQQQKLQYVSVSGTEMTITGANLNIVSGAGATNSAINGLGNLVVGYNESSGDTRTGSHNLVVGMNHSYSSYGGLVVGLGNTISGVFASVSGGRGNNASGFYSSVSGGSGNNASGVRSSVSGGNSNTASGNSSSVSGGLNRDSIGTYNWRAGTLFETQ